MILILPLLQSGHKESQRCSCVCWLCRAKWNLTLIDFIERTCGYEQFQVNTADDQKLQWLQKSCM